jgi:pilus assembly protein CpaC
MSAPLRGAPLLAALSAAMVLVLGGPAVAQDRNTIRLTVGESTLVRTEAPITRVIVGNENIADVRATSAREVLVVGVGRGSTTVSITAGGDRQDYTILVTAVEVGSLLALTRSFLGEVEGIYARVFGDTVVLEGEAMTMEDFGRAQRAVELFGPVIRNLVRFRPSAIEEVNRVIQRNGLAGVRATLVGGRLFLEGSVGSESEMRKAEAITRAYGLQVENLLTIGQGRMLEIAVEFLEIRRSGFDQIGIAYPTNASVQASAGGVFNFVGAGQDSLLVNVLGNTPGAALNLLFRSGYARLLAQPRLVCASGARAEFLAGGEVPVVVTTQSSVSVDFKPFGVRLETAPIADSLGNVSMEIVSEVSEVDESLRTLGVPGFRTRRVRTNVTVRDGETIVLSGLFQNTQQKAVQRFPILGHIPIIGELFRSREFRRDRSNLAIFVTPRVVTPESPRIQRAIREMQDLYLDAESDVNWNVLD